MGVRNRNGSKKVKSNKKISLLSALKEHTRAKAERELADGADFNDIKYTQHRNWHVRMRAWHLAGNVIPEDKMVRARLFETLTKGRPMHVVETFQQRFFPLEQEEQAA